MTTTMKASARRPSRLLREAKESADYLRSIGGIDADTHAQITLRQLGPGAPRPATDPVTPADVRQLRLEAHMSQAVFARYLNVSLGYVSQLERGARQPVGTTLVLLNVIRRNGVETIVQTG